MRVLQLVICCIGILFYPQLAMSQKIICDKSAKPTVLKPIENWEIISDNIANIKSKSYFSGKQLSYFIFIKQKDIKNTVKINSITGDIEIKAVAKDNFDVKVIVKNICGSVSSVFNVIIDEEE